MSDLFQPESEDSPGEKEGDVRYSIKSGRWRSRDWEKTKWA